MGDTILNIIKSEVGYGIICSLVAIFLTHLIKKLFKTVPARKRFTPLVTLGIGIIASLAYYLFVKDTMPNFGEIQTYITIAVFGMEISIAATGIYIMIKRIFGKASEDDMTLEDLFNTADKILPQGLLLISNFTGGDLTTAETLYAKVKEEVSVGLKEKKETVESMADKIVVLLSGWTDGAAVDLTSQAKLLVQAVKNELDAGEEKAQEALKASKVEKLEEDIKREAEGNAAAIEEIKKQEEIVGAEKKNEVKVG